MRRKREIRRWKSVSRLLNSVVKIIIVIITTIVQYKFAIVNTKITVILISIVQDRGVDQDQNHSRKEHQITQETKSIH